MKEERWVLGTGNPSRREWPHRQSGHGPGYTSARLVFQTPGKSEGRRPPAVCPASTWARTSCLWEWGNTGALKEQDFQSRHFMLECSEATAFLKWFHIDTPEPCLVSTRPWVERVLGFAIRGSSCWAVLGHILAWKVYLICANLLVLLVKDFVFCTFTLDIFRS